MLRRECRRLAPRLSAAGEGGASDLELRRHLQTCGRCRRRHGQFRRLGGLVRSVGAVELDRAVAAVRLRRRARRNRVVGGATVGIGLAGLAAAITARRRSAR